MDYNEIVRATEQYLVGVYKKLPVCFISGKGSKLYDTEGKEYTDFLAGIAVNALGYADSEETAAIIAQAQLFTHVSNLFYNEAQAELLQTLLAGTDFTKGFLCNSGAEANEAAIKLARKYFYGKNTDRYEIITLNHSFHGRTLLTATLTGQEKYSKPYAPLPPGVIHVNAGDETALKNAVTPHTAAILLEVIQGEAGVIEIDEPYLKSVAKLCRQQGILLVIDEIQTGMGRTGKMFAYEHYGVKPDIVTLAKALGGGLPLGAMLTTDGIASAFQPGDHGTTFGGNPVACAAGTVVLNRLKGGLLQEVQVRNAYFKTGLTALAEQYPQAITGVSGKGLLLGLSLNPAFSARDVACAMLQKSYIINATGNNVLRFAPPLVITEDEIAGMLKALAQTLEEMN